MATTITTSLFFCVKTAAWGFPDLGWASIGRSRHIAGSLLRPPKLKIMVKLLAEKPDAFKNFETGDVYYELFNYDGPYGYGCLNFTYAPVAIFHLEVERFAHNILKNGVKEDWNYFLGECKKNSCHSISVTSPGSFENNEKWMRFIRHFGFEDFTQYTASHQFIGEKHG